MFIRVGMLQTCKVKQNQIDTLRQVAGSSIKNKYKLTYQFHLS